MNVKILAAIATTALVTLGTGCGLTREGPQMVNVPGHPNIGPHLIEIAFTPGVEPTWTEVKTLQFRGATPAEFVYRCDGTVIPDMTEAVPVPPNDGGYDYSRTARVRLPEGQTTAVSDHCEWFMAGEGCGPETTDACSLVYATNVTATPTAI